MEEPDMSFVDADVILDEVAAIDQKRLLAFVNYYITRTVRFLNNFAGSAEAKLFQLEHRLGRLEGALSLLEAKLDSIPGLETIAASQPPAEVAITQTAKQVNEATAHQADAQGPQAKPEDNSQQEGGETAIVVDESSQPPPSETTATNTARNDPRYEKYFKMLRMGVLEMAVKQKMIGDGFDPNILDHPDQAVTPAVDGGPTNTADSEDDDDASVATFSSSD